MYRHTLLLLLVAALGGCHGTTPYSTTLGKLPPGKTIALVIDSGDVVAYKPAVGEASDAFTVSPTALDPLAPPAMPHIALTKTGIAINATDPLQTLLLRVPQGVALDVYSKHGNVSVTDISGNPNVFAEKGDVNVMVAGYAQATTDTGNINVTLGTAEWPGTLHFKTNTGDVVLYIVETAKFHVFLHTDNGVLFSDFGITGTSRGNSETIDQDVNGGGQQAIDIDVHQGTIHLMRLAPQA